MQVMPGCIVRLSYVDNTKFKGERWELPFVKDDVNGVFQELMDGEEYWVVVIENEAQLKKDQEETAKRMAALSTVRTVQYSIVQSSEVQYSTVQYSTVQCSTVQRSAVIVYITRVLEYVHRDAWLLLFSSTGSFCMC